MKICAYVQEAYTKQAYKNESLDSRQFVGLRVIIDCLERSGRTVDYAGMATVHNYDIVLVSLTSDCDWWSYISERVKWRKGHYKVLVGGAGVLHVAPFLPWFYAAMFGRGENLIVPLVQAIERGERMQNPSILYADEFDYERTWYVAQATIQYQHPIRLSDKKVFCEGAIGCNHKCLFCGYTWQRRFVSPYKEYKMSDSLFGGIEDKERAMLDYYDNPASVDFSKLRTTAIDGFSERLRFGVNKKITKEILQYFLTSLWESEAKPHQLKIYNICGYPTETIDDWEEFRDALQQSDTHEKRDKQWIIVLHNTPFRPMPATPMACAPISKRNYRGEIARLLGKGLGGNFIYRGNSFFCVESMSTESLSTVMLSSIAHRGGVEDCENIEKLCRTNKFWSASGAVKEATLVKYFDVDALFAAHTPQTLPSRYLRTYAKVEKMWGKTPLEIISRKDTEQAIKLN